MESSLIIILTILALVIGALIGWLLGAQQSKHKIYDTLKDEGKLVSPELLDNIKKEKERLQLNLQEKEELLRDTNLKLGAGEQQILHLKENLANHEKQVKEIQVQMEQRFELLANRLLEEKSEKFTKQNSQQLEAILNPIKEKLSNFEKKVNDVYQQEAKDRSSLKGEIKTLVELNQKISEEAKNLTKALKGDTKKQGNWGEFILEKVLERSGLQKGQEYEVQFAATNENGKRVQPDVVVHLPDEKHLIIDAKVSLVAYEQVINAESDEERIQHLKNHLLSLRNHIKGLSEKNYATAKGIDSPEFVLLFVPIESSFAIALQEDHELFQYAWERKIVMVSPSTLLATLRTVASLWKQEKQTKNALEIARQAGGLYDKFVGFVDDMQKIETSLEQAEKAYKSAFNKLQSGSGNLIRRAEKIKELGIKTTKNLPESMDQ
ncbi:MAG: DNA recombination protein RmuC [Saprospiraceae bacterium]|nr:DNA recombination protein RmuC [Saprospiraceae bacterium]